MDNTMYFLFAGETYYPCGGMSDLVGTFATLDEALAVAKNPPVDEDGYAPRYDWYHIATMVAGQLVIIIG